MKNCHILFILLVLSLAACKSDVDEFIPDPVSTTPVNFVTTSVGGQILDENNTPFAEVALEIHARNQIIYTTTDENGIFLVKNIEVRQDRVYLKALAEGYYLGSKTIAVQANATENVEIKLLPRNINGEFSANLGGAVQTGDGARVTFSPNSIADAAGNPYEGAVQVAMRWFNPSATDIFQQMPGNLLGEDAQGNTYVLGTAGMLAVELFSPDNEALNLLDGTTAELIFPVPTTLSNLVPSEIPLWSFDEEKGVWILEGTAQLSNNNYLATVTHFSFWNCDALFPVINGEGKVVDSNGNPVANALVKMTIQNGLDVRSGWTNSNGIFSGQLPQNEVLEITVFDACNEPIGAPMVVGPFSDDVVLDDIVITGDSNSSNIFGNVVDCEDLPVSEGYVAITGDNISQYAFLEADGSFNNTFLVCADSLEIVAVDLVNLKNSNAQVLTIEPTIDAGTIQACDDLAEFIAFDLNGEAFQYTDPLNVTGNSNDEGINIVDFTQGFSLFAETTDPQANIPIPVTFLMIESVGTIVQYNVSITLSAFGPNTGDLMEGTITGDFVEDNGATYTINGSFKVISDF